MRLIDADALADEIAVLLERNETLIDNWFADRIEDAIADAPTIDAVEVVRCGECKWRNEYGCHNPIWGDGWANYPSPNPKDDAFCSYGERCE